MTLPLRIDTDGGSPVYNHRTLLKRLNDDETIELHCHRCGAIVSRVSRLSASGVKAWCLKCWTSVKDTHS
jgi:hypothetical protein